MLQLGCRLRQLGAAPGTRVSAQLPSGAELPKKAGSEEPERPLPPLAPVAVDRKGCVTITIHAKPGSRQNADLTENDKRNIPQTHSHYHTGWGKIESIPT
uniref:Uncharacterized protein n=1 Tax=Prolemur simus TaxID=1328070 RepID=A0A8C9A8M1_PROSS